MGKERAVYRITYEIGCEDCGTVFVTTFDGLDVRYPPRFLLNMTRGRMTEAGWKRIPQLIESGPASGASRTVDLCPVCADRRLTDRGGHHE